MTICPPAQLHAFPDDPMISRHVRMEADPDAAFRTLLDMLRQRAGSFDAIGHVPRDVIAQMKRAGIFRSSTPLQFGGSGMAPAAFLSLVEQISTIDGSAGWVAAFGSANTYIAALPEETQAQIYACGPDQVYAGGLYPLSPATKVDGGYRVTGRWRFASGCKGADWIGVGISIDDGAGGPALAHMAVAPADQIRIIDNWHMLGMQGTGSHDTAVDAKLYAKDWICARGAKGIFDDPLYRYPALAYQAQVHAAVNLGLARGALDLAIALTHGAKLMPGAKTLGDRAYFRTSIARDTAALESARAYYYQSAEQAWARLLAGDEVGLDLTNALRLSASHAAHCATKVVQNCFRISGMAAAEQSHPMQRLLRDAMVVTQHAALSEATFDQAGQILCGMAAPAGYP